MAHGYLHFLAHRQKPEFHFDGQYQRFPESEQLAETFPYEIGGKSPLNKHSPHIKGICTRKRQFNPSDRRRQT